MDCLTHHHIEKSYLQMNPYDENNKDDLRFVMNIGNLILGKSIVINTNTLQPFFEFANSSDGNKGTMFNFINKRVARCFLNAVARKAVKSDLSFNDLLLLLKDARVSLGASNLKWDEVPIEDMVGYFFPNSLLRSVDYGFLTDNQNGVSFRSTWRDYFSIKRSIIERLYVSRRKELDFTYLSNEIFQVVGDMQKHFLRNLLTNVAGDTPYSLPIGMIRPQDEIYDSDNHFGLVYDSISSMEKAIGCKVADIGLIENYTIGEIVRHIRIAG